MSETAQAAHLEPLGKVETECLGKQCDIAWSQTIVRIVCVSWPGLWRCGSRSSGAGCLQLPFGVLVVASRWAQ